MPEARSGLHISFFSGNELVKLNLIDEVRVKGDDHIVRGC